MDAGSGRNGGESDEKNEEDDEEEGGNVDEDLVGVEAHLLEVVTLGVGVVSLLKEEPLANKVIADKGELRDLDNEVADDIEVGRDLH